MDDVLQVARTLDRASERSPVDDGASQRRWIVEGAGGLLVPLNEDALIADIAEALKLPVLIASSTRLGCINHTLLTVEVLRSRGIPCAGIVLIGADDPSASSGIAAFSTAPILGRLPHLRPLTPASVRAAGDALLTNPDLRALL